MGLLSVIRKQKLKDREIRCLMLGLDNAGKTTLVKALQHENINTISPTLGFNIQTVPLDGYRLTIWDVGGQDTLRPFWFNYFEKTDALVWVIDASALERLEECVKELRTVLSEERLQGACLLVIVNKIDLLPEEQVDSVISIVKETLPEINGHRAHVQACSAFTGDNVEEAFRWVVQDVKSRLYALQ